MRNMAAHRRSLIVYFVCVFSWVSFFSSGSVGVVALNLHSSQSLARAYSAQAASKRAVSHPGPGKPRSGGGGGNDAASAASLASLAYGTASAMWDPLARRDAFTKLSDQQISAWARALAEVYPPSASAAMKQTHPVVATLRRLDVTKPIEVRMVGLNDASQDEQIKRFRAISQQASAAGTTTFAARVIDNTTPQHANHQRHPMTTKRKPPPGVAMPQELVSHMQRIPTPRVHTSVEMHLTHAPHGVARAARVALAKQVLAQPKPSNLTLVDPDGIERALEDDFDRAFGGAATRHTGGAPAGAPVFYITSFAPRRAIGDGGATAQLASMGGETALRNIQHRAYAYHAVGAACPSTGFARHPTSRFGWTDVDAEAAVAFDAAVPPTPVQRRMSATIVSPAAAIATARTFAAFALAPPMGHVPEPLDASLTLVEVVVVVLHDDPGEVSAKVSAAASNMQQQQQKHTNEDGASSFSHVPPLERLRDSLRREVPRFLLPGQSAHITYRRAPLASVPGIGAAIRRAERHRVPSLQHEVNEAVDETAIAAGPLFADLARLEPSTLKALGVTPPRPDSRRVVLYVLEWDGIDTPLLDGVAQARAAPHGAPRAVALRALRGATIDGDAAPMRGWHANLACPDGTPPAARPGEVAAAALPVLAQAGWAVPPPAAFWAPESPAAQASHSFTSHTNPVASLSFSAVDAAKAFAVHATASSAMDVARKAWEDVEALGGASRVLLPAELERFYARSGLFIYKLGRCAGALGLANYNESAYLARASRVDAEDIRKIVGVAQERDHAGNECGRMNGTAGANRHDEHGISLVVAAFAVTGFVAIAFCVLSCGRGSGSSGGYYDKKAH